MADRMRAPGASGLLVARSEFARAFRHVPGPVAVVLVRTVGGPVRGITCTSATSLSGAPPMAVFSVDAKTAFADEVRRAGRYSINYLAADRAGWASAFASGGASLEALGPVVRDGAGSAPTLATGTTTVLECEVADVHPGGDHWIVTGRITHSRTQSDAPALVYVAGRYGRFAEAADVVPADAPDPGAPRGSTTTLPPPTFQ
jgi:3-hydroxy-9,10-secoandrosta-1,3,5(10)-triene-9,17-dione monooxygenase reductase component